MRVGIIQSTGGPDGTKRQRSGIFSLSQDAHLLLPMDIRALGFQVFDLGLGIAQLASLVFRPLESD